MVEATHILSCDVTDCNCIVLHIPRSIPKGKGGGLLIICTASVHKCIVGTILKASLCITQFLFCVYFCDLFFVILSTRDDNSSLCLCYFNVRKTTSLIVCCYPNSSSGFYWVLPQTRKINTLIQLCTGLCVIYLVY